MQMDVEVKCTRPEHPTIVDDDEGIISVVLRGCELSGWCYDNDDERRVKMQRAHAYVEGWCDAVEKIYSGFDSLLAKGTS